MILSVSLAACTTKTHSSSHRTVKDFPEGKQIIVDRTDIHEEDIGVVSKIVYHTTDKHQYQLRFLPEDIRWENGDAEPKQLLNCADGAVYLHFVAQQANPYYETEYEAANSTELNKNDQLQPQDEKLKKVEPYFILKSYYARFVDKRYFFKLLGESYWVDINKDEYVSLLKKYQAYEVPNENYYQTTTN